MRRESHSKFLMIRYLLTLFFIFVPLAINAINLDGVIDGEWDNALRYELLYEIDPALNGKSTLKTTALVQYDKEYLYIGFKVYGNPAKLYGTYRSRDTGFNEDYVALILDPYNDNRVNLGIGVTSMGSQLDWKHLSSRDDDASWNILFFSKTQITDWGYTAELQIPFSELQFDENDVNKFRLGFIRKSYERGIATLFSDFKTDPSLNCTLCTADKVIELEGIKKSKRKYLYPYFTSNQAGNRDSGEFKTSNPDLELGVSGLYDVSAKSFLEFTINPDFSQVEADAPQIDVNETFALRYPEKRTFFLEGLDLLKNTLGTVYTRSINNPQNALKFIQQNDNSTFLLLSSIDESSPYQSSSLYRSYLANAGKSRVTIARYKKSLPNVSNIGLLVTNRDYDAGGDSTLLELDGIINFLDYYSLEFDLAQSDSTEPNTNNMDTSDTFSKHTYELDGESFTGDAHNIRISRDKDDFFTGIRFKKVSEGFRADVGYIRQAAYKEANFWTRKAFRFDNTVRLISLRASNQNRYDLEGNKVRDRYEYAVRMETSKNIYLNFETKLDLSETYYQYNFGKKSKTNFSIDYYPSEKWFFNSNSEIGEEIAYSIDEPIIADLKSLNNGVYYKPNNNLVIGFNSRYYELKDPDTNKKLFAGSIDSISSSYSFNNDLIIKAKLEKNEFQDHYFLESLVKWAPNPYIIFYAGGAQFFNKSEFSTDNDLRLETSNIYLKFQYFYSL